MFVAILNDAHSDSTSSDKNNEDIEVANLLLSKFLQLVGIRKNKRRDSLSINEENETSKKNTRQEASGTQLSVEDKEEQELSTKVDMGVTTSETNWQNDTSEPFRSSPSLDSRHSFDQRSEPPGLIHSSFLTDRLPESAMSRTPLGSSSFDTQHTPVVIRDETPAFFGSGEVRIVQFGRDVHVTQLSITSSNSPIASCSSPCLSNMQSTATVNSEESNENTGKVPLAGDSVEVASVGHAYQTTHEECEKRKERIINFDEVSEWLKNIDLSGKIVCRTTGRPKERETISTSSGLQVGRRAGIDFDVISSMIKIRRKLNKHKERANESNTTLLKNRAKRLDRLLYVLN